MGAARISSPILGGSLTISIMSSKSAKRFADCSLPEAGGLGRQADTNIGANFAARPIGAYLLSGGGFVSNTRIQSPSPSELRPGGVNLVLPAFLNGDPLIDL